MGWRCQLVGHHLWGYPASAYESRVPVGDQICVRAGCTATRTLVTPNDEEPVERPLPLMAVAEILRLRRWDWGEPLDGPYPLPREVVADGP